MLPNMGRPPSTTAGLVRVVGHVPPHLYDRLTRDAILQDRTLSWLVRRAIETYVAVLDRRALPGLDLPEPAEGPGCPNFVPSTALPTTCQVCAADRADHAGSFR